MLKCWWKLLTPMAVLCMQDLEVQCTWPSGSWDWDCRVSWITSWWDLEPHPCTEVFKNRLGTLPGWNIYFLFLSLIFANQSSSRLPNAEGRPGVSDVSLLSGISGLSFDSPFLSPLLFFLPSPSCSFCLVIFLLMVHSPDFFPENSQIVKCLVV